MNPTDIFPNNTPAVPAPPTLRMPPPKEPTPRERFHPDSSCEESGHTPATWAAFVHSEAVGQAAAIYEQVQVLAEAVDEWVKLFGDARDPGADAIAAAGLPLPDVVRKYRTSMTWAAEHIKGLRWALGVFEDMTRDVIPDPGEWNAEGYFIPPAERGKAA